MTDIASPQIDSNNTRKRPPKPVVVTVGDTPVTVPDKEVTGLQIKEAAIGAGVPITLNFVLFDVTKKGREMVRDDDVVKVTKKSTFEAVADDINS